MFGLLLFGHTPFASSRVLGEKQWIEICPSSSEWNTASANQDSWNSELKTTSDWDVKAPNVLSIKGCK